MRPDTGKKQEACRRSDKCLSQLSVRKELASSGIVTSAIRVSVGNRLSTRFFSWETNYTVGLPGAIRGNRNRKLVDLPGRLVHVIIPLCSSTIL